MAMLEKCIFCKDGTGSCSYYQSRGIEILYNAEVKKASGCESKDYAVKDRL
jgi:hypothetical protein